MESKNHHVVVTGTGRAGTSFIVQYLDANGIDTHLRRNPAAELDPHANAGLEDFPVPGALDELPYVIKSPWLAYNPEAWVPASFVVDALIVPVRRLADAARSRVALERRAMHEKAPWMRTLSAEFDHWAGVPGGMVYELSEMDQARHLAVGFHRVVEYALEQDIPLIFLQFPRLVQDGEYLFQKLSSVFDLDRGHALKAHARIARPTLVGNSFLTT